MTDEMMSLRTLLEKSSDADLLREMISFTAQRLMELEVEGLTGAAHGERNPERITSATATATGRGRRGPARLSCASPSCGRKLLPRLPGTTPAGREGLGSGGAGSLRARRIDALGRRPGQGHGA
jgi:hypothetical protein